MLCLRRQTHKPTRCDLVQFEFCHATMPHHPAVILPLVVFGLLWPACCLHGVNDRSIASSSGSCPSCWTREAKRYHDIETIKANILKKLRLTRPPNITVPNRPPNIPFVQMYIDSDEMMGDAPSHDFMAPSASYEDAADGDGLTTVRIIHFALPAHRDQSVLRFELQRQVTTVDNVQAFLGLFVRMKSGWSRNAADLTIYRLAQLPGDRQPIKYRSIRPRGSTSSASWHRFNITSTVAHWSRYPQLNFGLQVEISDPLNRSSVVLHPNSGNIDFVYRPYLEVHVRDQSNPRTRRTASLNCEEHGIEKRCCRYPLIVDFQSFQWKWIIAPKRYAAFYCSGECSFRYVTTYPHSSIVQMELEKRSETDLGPTRRNSSSSGPCCAPIKTSNISMLHYNEEGNVILSILPDMVVDQCGCT